MAEAEESNQEAVPETTEATYVLSLPLVQKQNWLKCDRVGFCALGDVADYDVLRLGAGWYQSWSIDAAPLRPGGMEFVQAIRLRDEEGDTAMDAWPPDWSYVAQAIEANPGALWLIGNEPDVESQDNCTPGEYSSRYHECYHYIKTRDASANISAPGIVQPTQLRLEWLNQVLTTYEGMYGETMPVDVWNIHVQILPERRDGWGCEIPPGLPDDLGEDHQVDDNADAEIFKEKILMFRQWMHDHGQGGKPLIISEYGVLMPSGYGYLGGASKELGDQMVKGFMRDTFDYCFCATDPELGYAPDGYRLVQKWAWYSLNDRMADLDAGYLGFNGSLFEPERDYPGVITQFGICFQDTVASLECH